MNLRTTQDLKQVDEDLKQINLRKQMILTKMIVNSINEVDENLPHEDLANSIAFIMHEYYSKQNRVDFLKAKGTKQGPS